MYKLVITDTAKRDIDEIVLYIKQELRNVGAANAVLDSIVEGVSSLSIMPLRNPPLQDRFLKNQKFRFILVKSYIILYTVSSDTVSIIRCVYGKRNWKDILYSMQTEE